MDIEDIKQFIPEDGEKIILMENGKPVVVLMSFNTYKKEFRLKEEEKKNISEPLSHNQDSMKNELTIEDLPF